MFALTDHEKARRIGNRRALAENTPRQRSILIKKGTPSGCLI
jgi:hypothetical protein